MYKFNYQGFDKDGARVEGYIMANDISHARAQLKQQGLLIKRVVKHNDTQDTLLIGKQRLSLADVQFLTSELSLLLDAGLKIDKSIELLKKANKKAALAEMLEQLSRELRTGKQLSQVLSEYPKYFDRLYINLVSIGEATGQLAQVFRQLSADMLYKNELQKKISQALTYPAVILFVCISSIFFIFNYVVPNMASMFEGQQNLPFYTQMLLSSSLWLGKYQWGLLASVLLLIIVAYNLRDNVLVQRRWQWLLLRMPIFKQAILLVERIRFNGSLAMMLQSGVAIDHALDLACGNIRNTEIRAELMVAISKIKRGDQLSQMLGQTQLYPDFFSSLLAIGEESGELAKIFHEITNRSQKAFSDWVVRFTSLLEPLLILIMGGVVGSVVVIMMLSITNVSDVGF